MAKRKNRKTTRSISFMTIAGLVILLAVAFGVIFFLQRPAAASEAAYPAEISVQEAYERADAGAWVLDVREPSEWNEYHIPGATLIPLGELSSRVNEVPSDQEVIVVCRSGNRSATGRDILRQAGFEKVTSMAGGMSQWRSIGHPTVSGP